MKKYISCKNPIIPNSGICDPHIKIFNNKAYLYASHDYNIDNEGFKMKDWQIWSSSDLVNWIYESTVKPEDTYIGCSDACWAPDAASRNDKYYFYFSNGMKNTGVASADNPGGVFTDALGEPLLKENLCKTLSYDPAVFLDDDSNKTPYIIFGTPIWAGGDSYYISRLNNDMISLAENPQKIQLDHEADDKPFLHKYNGRYYLSWASEYAIADNVYGPYQTIGDFKAAGDHGSFFDWHNQSFFAFGLPDPVSYYRGTGICYIHYRNNGEIVSDHLIIEYGVGQYNAEWNEIKAVWYMKSKNIKKVEQKKGDFEISASQGAYLYFPNIQNLKKNSKISFRYKCDKKSTCIIEIRRDSSTGKIIGQLDLSKNINQNPRFYSTGYCQLNNPSGKLDLYLTFRGKGKELCRLEWFRFFNY